MKATRKKIEAIRCQKTFHFRALFYSDFSHNVNFVVKSFFSCSCSCSWQKDFLRKEEEK